MGADREAVLALVAGHDAISTAKVAKRLGLAQSQLQRMLTTLREEGLVEVDEEEGRTMLRRPSVAPPSPSGGGFGSGPTPTVVHPPPELLPEGGAVATRPTSRSLDALHVEATTRTPTIETVAEETAIALVYNGKPHAVMMATPADLGDFAIGFTLTEGIADSFDEIRITAMRVVDAGVSIEIEVPQTRVIPLAHERNLAGRTGCGLCGTSTLEAAIRPVRHIDAVPAPALETLAALFARLHEAQSLNRETGAVHAAGVLVDDGSLIVREDVGRHNAIDKALGASAARGRRALALLVTSRASYEVVHKAAQMNCPLVAAISAPTALAVRLAIEAGVTLAGFVRGNRFTRYA